MRLSEGKHGRYFKCCACGVGHGAHPDGTPHGIPADRETRQARIRAHDVFDSAWKAAGVTRREAYVALQRIMGLSSEEAHIGRFTSDLCDESIGKLQGEISWPDLIR